MISKTSVVDSEYGVNDDSYETDGNFSHKYQIQISQVQRKWEWSYLRVSYCTIYEQSLQADLLSLKMLL